MQVCPEDADVEAGDAVGGGSRSMGRSLVAQTKAEAPRRNGQFGKIEPFQFV